MRKQLFEEKHKDSGSQESVVKVSMADFQLLQELKRNPGRAHNSGTSMSSRDLGSH